MARLKQALEPEDVKSLTVKQVKEKYNSLAVDYNKLINLDYIYCPICGEFKSAQTSFYHSRTSKSGYAHCGCKQCLLNLGTDLIDKKTNERKDNREKTIEVFKMLDLPFIDDVYESQLNLINEEGGSRRGTAFSQLLTLVSSLPQYAKSTFKDSVFRADDLENNIEENQRLVQKTIRAAKKRFGAGYSDSDYQELEDEYQSWCSRVEVSTKSQEEVVENLAIIKLLKRKALLDGKPTKDLDKQQQDWLDAGNLKPKQNSGNGYADTLTFGQLIEKWENEEPIPEPDPELADVDGIGKMIRVWFTGHLRRVLGLDGGYNKEYDEYIEQYTVEKPSYAGVDEEDGENDVYTKLFGKEE